MSHKNNQKLSLKTNFLLKLASLSSKNQKGFTLPTGVAIGLLALAGTTLALAKANKDQTNMTSNQGARQVLATANGGINQSLNGFTQDNNAYLLLGEYDGTQWTFEDLRDNINSGDNEGDYSPPANACSNDGGTVSITEDFVEFVENIAENETFNETGILGSDNSASKGSYKLEQYKISYPTSGLNLTAGVLNRLEGNLLMEGQNSNKAENKGQYLTNFNINIQTPPPPVDPSGAAAVIAQSIDAGQMQIFTNVAICTDPGGPGCTNGATISCGSDGVLSNQDPDEYADLQELLGSGNNGEFSQPNNQDNTNIIIQSLTIPPIPIVTNYIGVNFQTGQYSDPNLITMADTPILANNSNSQNNLFASSTIDNSSSTTKTVNPLMSAIKKIWNWIDAPAYAYNFTYYMGLFNAVGTELQSDIITTQDTIALINEALADDPNNTDIQADLATAQDILLQQQQALTDYNALLPAMQAATRTATGLRIINQAEAIVAAIPNTDYLFYQYGGVDCIPGALPPGGGNTDLELNIHELRDDRCYSSMFTTQSIDSDNYTVVNFKITNFLGNLNKSIKVKIDRAELNARSIDTTKMIIRLYMPENFNMGGGTRIEVVDGDGNNLTGVNETERAEMSSLRLIAGNPNGTYPASVTWTIGGTSCIVGQIHGPTLSMLLSQGNGCGASGGSAEIDLNAVMGSDYEPGEYEEFRGGASANSPNIFGTIWARSISDGGNGGPTGGFYENTSLSEALYAEYGDAFPDINGAFNQTTVGIDSAGITGLTRKRQDYTLPQ